MLPEGLENARRLTGDHRGGGIVAPTGRSSSQRQMRIPVDPALEKTGVTTWQQALAEAYTRPADLLTDLGVMDRLSAADIPSFPMRVPRGYARRMRYGDPRDPLLLQVLPRAMERDVVDGYSDDPVGELASARQPGLLQKYAARALVISTGACAVHCRYCFRRAFPYQNNLPESGFSSLIDALRSDPGIREVILSGGDPLSLSDRRLSSLLSAIDEIPHVQRIRVHARTPVVLPERVDDGLTKVLAAVRKPLVIVLHCNHGNEIDHSVATAINTLREHSAAVLNQSVLLHGINDSAATLVDLSERLFAAGVLPYYLHQLDLVTGSAHFAVSDEQAREIVTQAATRLPGYLVPRLVREVAGAQAKLPV